MRKISDTEIVQFLKSGERAKENDALRYLHQNLFKLVIKLVKEKKGQIEDAEDVMQEGLVAFFKMARLDKLPDQVNVEAYLFTICRNKWYRKWKRKPNTSVLDNSVKTTPIEDIELKKTLNDEKPRLMDILKNRLGGSCYQMLVYFYYEGRKMKEIAQLFSYESEQVAKNKKARCMKTLKSLIQAEPALAGAFR